MRKNQKGFTLIEVLLYVGITAIIAGSIFGILNTVTKTGLKQSASNEASTQLNFVMQTVQGLVKSSSLIESPTATTTATSTLKLRMENPLKDPTCISLVGGVIKLAEGPDENNKQNCTSILSNLTDNNVVVDQLDFKKFSQYPGHDVVSLNIQITSGSINSTNRVTRNLQASIARVSAATFDSDLVPGSTGTFNVGNSSGNLWKDAAFSGILSAGSLFVSGNVGIGTSTAATLFSVATSTNIFNVLSNGNVGIGTATPSSKLTLAFTDPIVGSMGFGDVGGNLWFDGGSDAVGTIKMNTAGGRISFMDSSNNERVSIMESGNVGIGTTAPGYKLDIDTGIQNALVFGAVLKGRTTNETGNYGPVLGFQTEGTSPNLPKAGIAFVRTGGYGTGALQFLVDSTIDNNPVQLSDSKMTILYGGNVGIGTTTPAQKLDVAGTISMTGFKMASGATSGYVLTTNASGVGTWQAAAAASAAPQVNSVVGNTDISAVYSYYVDMTDMTYTDTFAAGNVMVTFKADISAQVGLFASAQLLKDNVVVDTTVILMHNLDGMAPLMLNWVGQVSAASHTFKVQWRTNYTGEGGAQDQVGSGYPRRLTIIRGLN